MGQAGAQREPSMEEILASIRKIIENNESDRPAPVEPTEAAEPETPQPVASAEAEHAVEPESVADEAPAPYAEVKPAEPVRSEPAPRQAIAGVAEIFEAPAAPKAFPTVAAASETPAQPPVSLADVAARVRAEATAPVGTLLDDAALAELQDMLAEETVTPAAGELPRAADGLQAVARAMAASAPETPAAPVAAAQPVEEPISAPERPAPSQLISVDAEARVAASFEALSQAVAGGNLRSFDEIAEDLLRPMLQSWLDDNLPTLVERLVREEIERVSRGPRR